MLRSRLSENLSWRFKWTADHQLPRTYVDIRNFGDLISPTPDGTDARESRLLTGSNWTTRFRPGPELAENEHEARHLDDGDGGGGSRVRPAGERVSFLDRAYGTPQLGLSARSRAMGGAGAAMGAGCSAWWTTREPGAPARQPRAADRFSGSGQRERLVPLFDTFDSFVDETAVAVNDHGYGDLQGGVVLDNWGGRGVIVSGGVFTRYDPRYDYFDELRTSDNSDTLRNNKIIATDGLLRTATLGVALPFGDGSGLGVAVNYYFGTLTDREALVSVATSDYASPPRRGSSASWTGSR